VKPDGTWEWPNLLYEVEATVKDYGGTETTSCMLVRLERGLPPPDRAVEHKPK
jgi:hypothetical protein